MIIRRKKDKKPKIFSTGISSSSPKSEVPGRSGNLNKAFLRREAPAFQNLLPNLISKATLKSYSKYVS